MNNGCCSNQNNGSGGNGNIALSTPAFTLILFILLVIILGAFI